MREIIHLYFPETILDVYVAVGFATEMHVRNTQLSSQAQVSEQRVHMLMELR